MPADREQLGALAAEVGRFHLHDRGMLRAQETIGALLAEPDDISEAAAAAYLAAVRRYFSGFEREARTHLIDVDRRLGKVSQVQFNLTAERGVTARRVEITRGILARLTELGAE
jgi:hypothetical protein